MRRAFINRRAIRATHASQAQVFVVRGVAAPPRLVSFVASLIGGLLVSTTLFADPPGPALVYDRALRLERWMWITPACSRASPKTTEVLQLLVARSGPQGARARWHLINQAEFAERAARARAQKRGTSELVTLVSTGEVLPAVQQRHAQTLTRFASGSKWLCLSEGLAGVCGQ